MANEVIQNNRRQQGRDCHFHCTEREKRLKGKVICSRSKFRSCFPHFLTSLPKLKEHIVFWLTSTLDYQDNHIYFINQGR